MVRYGGEVWTVLVGGGQRSEGHYNSSCWGGLQWHDPRVRGQPFTLTPIPPIYPHPIQLPIDLHGIATAETSQYWMGV